VTDFLHAKVKEIEERLHQLRPLVTEYQRLEAAVAALGGLDGDASVSGARARGNGARAQSGNGARRGRPRGSRGESTRATEAVELVRTRPGITIPELAGHMGIKPNYLYRVLPQLEEDGKVRRIEKGWHPA
jgi:predicted Rossmann fold nucleotide-binding protein DprA/Smf involved in DNA uptake